MKAKKLVALILAVLMVVGCIAGCDNNPGTTTEPSKSTTPKDTTVATTEASLFNVGSLPIVNEEITLKVLTQDPVNVAYDTAEEAGYWTWLEEQTGIHFEVESYSAEELKNKLPLIMASPDQMPDLFIRCDFKEQDVVNYGNGGQLLKLNDLLDEYGTNIKELWEEKPESYGAFVVADGSIYAVPSMNNSTSHVIYAVNERFLENAGQEIPTTLEELTAAMIAMTKADANGDGIVGNEILWSCEPKQFKRQALSMVGIAAYWPWEGCIFDDKDGEVFFAPTSAEYKYLLGELRKMYKAGAIDEEIFTQTYEQHIAKYDQDLVFMGEYYDDPQKDNYKGMEGWTFIDPLTSAVHDEPVYVVGSEYQVAIGAISAFTEYPEVCALLLDYMYSEEASMASRWGLEGVDFEYVTKEPLVMKTLIKDHEPGFGETPILAPRWVRDDMVKAANTDLAQLLREKKEAYGKFGWQNYLHLTQEQTDKIAELSTDLGLYCDDYWAGFINGTYDLDKDWDAYVKECEKMGAAELTAVYQEAYNTFFGVE